MVEEIKELSSENQSKSLAQRERLIGRKIKVHHIGAAQYGPSRVPELARRLRCPRRRVDSKRGKHESSLIEPAIERLMAGVAALQSSLPRDVKGKVSRIVNDVWTCGKGASIGNVTAKDSIEGFSAARRGYSSHLPTSKDRLRYTAGVASEAFSFAVRQFVDVAHTQPVAKVWGYRTFFRVEVVGILNTTLVHIAICGPQ